MHSRFLATLGMTSPHSLLNLHHFRPTSTGHLPRYGLSGISLYEPIELFLNLVHVP